MRLGLDLDGVLVDMHRGLVDVINSMWPNRLADGTVPQEWDLTSLGLSDNELGAVWARIRETRNWWMGLPAYPRNVHAVARHRIMHPEDEIFYVTARTADTDGLPLMHQSQRWLEMCGIAGLGTAVIVAPPDTKKVDVYESLGVRYAVDDALHIVEEGPHILYLIDRAWNRKDRSPGLDVVNSLDEFFKLTRRQA